MQVYEVGGAVRDSLLGDPVRERDWVVVGATARQLLDAGYRQVGSDFPVFLHPQTGEEYALARTERKTGPGHTGFAVDAAATVTLEAALLREDRAQLQHQLELVGMRLDQALVLRHQVV